LQVSRRCKRPSAGIKQFRRSEQVVCIQLSSGDENFSASKQRGSVRSARRRHTSGCIKSMGRNHDCEICRDGILFELVGRRHGDRERPCLCWCSRKRRVAIVECHSCRQRTRFAQRHRPITASCERVGKWLVHHARRYRRRGVNCGRRRIVDGNRVIRRCLDRR
jgi:hypothetical protein